MVNEGLTAVTLPPPLPNYIAHWYTPGDEAHWLAIHRAADPYNSFSDDAFANIFANPALDLGERQCYLRNAAGEAVAVATAWEDDHDEYPGYGMVHWVAVLPAYQRQGLGKMLMSVLCRRMLDLGYGRAFLRTDTRRQPAIRLYEQFGFVTVDIGEW